MAVDGGGTKTQFALYDGEKGTVRLTLLGTTSHEQLPGGYTQLGETLKEMAGQVLGKQGLTPADIVQSAWGLAGLDTQSQYKIIHGLIEDAGFERFALCNDSDLGIKAALPQGYGVCLVNGTGFNCVGINERGERYQIGSLFELTGDFGGGLFLGQQAVKTAYMNLFRHRRQSILTEMVLDLYEVSSRHDLLDRVTDWAGTGRLPVPGVAKCVFDAANRGDEEACALLARMGEEYALSVKSLLQELPFADREIDIVLVGSLFTKGWSEIHLRALARCLARSLPEKACTLHILDCPPVVGALAWALAQDGIADPWTKARACFAQ